MKKTLGAFVAGLFVPLTTIVFVAGALQSAADFSGAVGWSALGLALKTLLALVIALASLGLYFRAFWLLLGEMAQP